MLLISALAVTGGLAGCATQLTAQVTTFNQVADDPKALAGQRFSIVPTEAQKSSLEFGTYADLVRGELIGRGLVDASQGRADVTAGLSYSTTTLGTTMIGPGATGGGVAFGGGGIGIGIGFPLGRGGDSASYRHELRVTMDRAGSRVYEGTVVNEGTSASIAPVMPALVRALFATFPGRSGESRRVDVPLEAPAGSTPAAAR